MTVIYSVESLQFTKNYDGLSTLVVQARQDTDMIVEHCFSARHYMGTHIEYLADNSLVYFVIKLKHAELRFVFPKPADLVRVYLSEIVALMGF